MFYEAVKFTIENEGGYSDDPDDKGGKTKYGISQASNPEVDVENLTLTEAELIYRKKYWNPLYAQLPKKLGIKLFDIGVNIGVKTSIRVLQATLNRWFDTNLMVDGVFGSQTLSASLRANSESLYSMFLFECSLYYESLKNYKYFIGWLNRLYKEIK